MVRVAVVVADALGSCRRLLPLSLVSSMPFVFCVVCVVCAVVAFVRVLVMFRELQLLLGCRFVAFFVLVEFIVCLLYVVHYR